MCGVGVGCVVCVLSYRLCDTQLWEHGEAPGCCAIQENWFCNVTQRCSLPQPALTCKAGYFLVTTLSEEIAAKILLYSCYLRNAGHDLQTPNLRTAMTIRA